MASDWIKMEKSLQDKPEVRRLARVLSVTRWDIIGRLLAVWSWADTHSISGENMDISEADIDDLADLSGFAVALRQVGWLQGRDAALQFPNFDRHNGQTAKRRALDSFRQNRNRSKPPPDCVSVTNVTLECGHERDKSVTREEKRREDKEIHTPQKPPKGGADSPEAKPVASPDLEYPPPLDTEAFRSAWADWLAYRRQRKISPLKPLSVAAKLAELAEWGEPSAIAAIRQSIGNGWQGIFAPRPDASGGNQKSHGRRASFA
jgi:hypothetical protein